MAMNEGELRAILIAAFPDAQVRITDLAGDGDHYAAHVASAAFQGLNRVAQHKAVYAALGGRMGGVLHALQLTTQVLCGDTAVDSEKDTNNNRATSRDLR